MEFDLRPTDSRVLELTNRLIDMTYNEWEEVQKAIDRKFRSLESKRRQQEPMGELDKEMVGWFRY